ncbi:MAG: ECF transporter S component [Chloroflexi bacterium]|nr:ECF transporter S component [Chloroflexota bacterium]
MGIIGLQRGSITMALTLVGVGLYAGAAYFSFVAQVPGTEGVFLRPGFAILPLVGIVLGPLSGFATGFLGNALADGLTGYGVTTAPLWHVANGMVGLIAGLLVLRLRSTKLWMDNRAEISAVVGIVAIALGFLLVFGDIPISGMTPWEVLSSEYLPTVFWNGLATAIGLPILLQIASAAPRISIWTRLTTRTAG